MASAEQIKQAVTGVQSHSDFVQRLLADTLGWPIGEKVQSIQEIGFGWTEEELHAQGLDENLKGPAWQIQPFRHDQPWGIFLLEFADGQVYRKALRQVLRGLVPNRRRDPSVPSWRHDNLLFIATTHDYDSYTFAHFRGEKAASAKLVTFGWERGERHLRTLCEYNLPALHWPEDDGQDKDSWLKAWTKAFDKEPLTKDFFRRFDSAVQAVKADLEEYQKLESAEAYSRAQLLLERLLFLYFLQNRGWLNQQRDYLSQNFQPFRAKAGDFSFYQEFLERLFWTLATAPGSPYRLPGIPFLNGGLFDDDEFAPPMDTRKKQHPPLKIRNTTFETIFEQLLEAFNFTVREDTPLDQDVAVDPEMLGKVFESIVLHAEAADPDAVAPDKRKATGSYYTPRIVVHFICREVLRQYLQRHLPGDNWEPRLKALLDMDAAQGLLPEQMKKLRELLKPEEGRIVLEKLRDLKCCDPAVGSGAFPVGLMHELVNLRRVVETAANGYVDPIRMHGTSWLHDVKEHIVENCLFGVDIQQQAIEICRLRLWLSLVVDYDLGLDPFNAERAQFQDAIDRISQLPNLEMNFHRGDSLLDVISNVPVRIEAGAMNFRRGEILELQKLTEKLHHAKKSEQKKQLRIDILRRRLDLTQRVLKEELTKLGEKDSALAAQFFGEDLPEREKRKRIAHEMQQVQEALSKIEADRKEVDKLAGRPLDPAFYAKLRKLEGADFNSPFNFAWRLDFASILAREQPGFDIIVGNPPFVTARNPIKRELYRERWPSVCKGEYLLLCPFFVLSFGLLRPKGELGFIASNAFAKREIGKPLIEKFFPRVKLGKLVDCSGLMFPGHGTPTCIVFGSNYAPDVRSKVRVVGILPGGGDLRTPPEDSPLWATLSQHHDDPGYMDSRICVVDRSSSEMAIWPWSFDASAQPTVKILERNAKTLKHFCKSYGSMFDTHKDDVFMMPGDQARRLKIELESLVPFVIGDFIRNWQLGPPDYLLKPYESKWQLRKEDNRSRLFKYLRLFRKELGGRATFGGGSYDDAGESWYRYHQMSVEKITSPYSIVYPEIGTHAHFQVQPSGILFPQTVPLVCLADTDENGNLLVSAVLNSSSCLLWLKQVCFSKRESQEGATDTYFEFAGRKVERLPMPDSIQAGAKKDSGAMVSQLCKFSRECWEHGRQVRSFAMVKIFDKRHEAYNEWNASLPGFVLPHSKIDKAFSKADGLRVTVERAIQLRDQLRAEMIARQEEMDWLVYAAYGLIHDPDPTLPDADLSLAREQRPFCLWAKAGGDFAKAVALIPPNWSEARKALWKTRLELIRDNQHVRRIEQPVYKRRWDEQWKIGGRWECGQPAYDAEFLDAFYWWLSEKAEWWLENEKNGGPATLEEWTTALWSDPRVQAAWQVAAEAEQRLEQWKLLRNGQANPRPVLLDPSRSAFARFFKTLVKHQSVPENIPFAVPWEELEKKKLKIPAVVKKIRGKLNVPRERFRTTEAGKYLQARPL